VGLDERSTLALPLRFLPGVGPRRAERLAASGLHTVEDLLLVLPIRYEDRRTLSPIASIAKAGPWTVRGRLSDLRLVRTRRRGFAILRARIEDGTGTLPVTWFNQPYLKSRLEAGGEWILHGAIRGADWGAWEMTNPSCEAAGGESRTGRIVPVYPRGAGLSSLAVGRLVEPALARLRERPPDDALPDWLRARYALPTVSDALVALHAPAPDADLAALNAAGTAAHARLVYGEMLDFQLRLARLRARGSEIEKPHRFRFDDATRGALRSVLPFPLTGAQRRVLKEIADDLRSPRPMLRLLQGDVGSGKTILAALCLLLAAESGLQGAFMAPTELLAEQHFATLRRWIGGRCRVELVTSASPAKLRDEIARGGVDVVVGTHALIQEGLRFRSLGLAVVDEQHRFGVEQRRRLESKGDRPDVLVMTATPIPRTLTLTLYGDLDLSLLDEMPPGRGEVRTEVVGAGERRSVYRRLRAALAEGAQAYIVFPRIEEGDAADGEEAASVAKLGERLREYLRDFPSAVLHGRLPAEEREAAMRDFAAGRLRALVATTVIEVGVDVPDATWMVIEGAERFGLSQLHQLRGRVGRGARPSTCVAIHGRLTEEAGRRLDVFAATRDGFAIAEADLSIRGPGDLLGTRQAGLPRFRVADLATHRAWIERAAQDARELVSRLGEPELSRLRQQVDARVEEVASHLAGG
jgi:ATP-dependent DNA helicase RecG